MITVRMGKFEKARINQPRVLELASRLADSIADAGVNGVKLALVNRGKVVTGETLRSVRWRVGALIRGPVNVGDIYTVREVIGAASLRNIITGRRAGAKMPIRVIGRGPRGGKIFEPLPRMMRWFRELGIPEVKWFPIMRRFSQRGIMPHRVDLEGIKIAKRSIRPRLNIIKVEFQRGLLVKI